MIEIKFAFRWAWILGLALLFPVGLPAGGGERNQLETCHSASSRPFLSGNSCVLRSSPSAFAPGLCTLYLGTPLTVLRSWKRADGTEWLMVQIASHEIFELSPSVRRGWINV